MLEKAGERDELKNLAGSYKRKCTLPDVKSRTFSLIYTISKSKKSPPLVVSTLSKISRFRHYGLYLWIRLVARADQKRRADTK